MIVARFPAQSRASVTDPRPPTSVSCTDFPRFAAAAGELIGKIDHADLFDALHRTLDALLQFDNFIVFHFQEHCAAELLHTNLNRAKLMGDMAPYVKGLYLLDPFYIATRSGQCRGLATIAGIAPEGFRDSEYYKLHYLNVDVVDEARFLVQVGPAEFVHVFVEREPPHEPYSATDLRQLEAIEPFVRSVVEKHWSWRRMSESVRSGSRTPLAFGVRTVIQSLGGHSLTAREVDIVELAIKGHSAKSIAHLLGISEGTVINHKRNVYTKLAISSQAQLFHAFLQALYAEERAAPGDVPRSA